MKVPQGYKQTGVGIIPEDWDVSILGNVFTIGNGKDYKHLPYGNIPVYGTGGIITYVNEYLYNGEVVCIGRKGTIDKPQYHNGKIWTVDTLFYCHSFNRVIPKFIYYIANTIDWLSYNAASGVPSLTSENIANIPIALPPIEEQRRIAEALSDVDELIAALDKKIAKKKLIKQAAMQQLLTGKKRLQGFSGEWNYKFAIDICEILDNRRIPLNEKQRVAGKYPYCGANGIVDFIDQYIFDEELILIAEDGGNFEQFENRPIAYIMNGKYWVNNHAHILKAKQHYSQSFIFHQLEHKDITEHIVGGTRSKLTRSHLEQISFYIPNSYMEQQAIAKILSDMDEEILDLERKRDKYQLLKSGMMNKLLTGQIRIK